MSKLIKSGNVNVSRGKYKLNSEMFISKESYYKSGASQMEIGEVGEPGSDYSAKSLIESAEQAALELMDNAQEAADKLIEDARQIARQIEQEALDNANEVYENARKKARDEAYDIGYAEGKSEADKLIDEALEIKRRMKIKSDEFMLDKEQELIKMVLAISKKVLSKEVEDLEYLETLAAEAMKHLNYSASIVIRVAAQDFDAANLAKPKIQAMAEDIDDLEIKADYALPPGSLVIDTVSGSIDASVRTQIERIEDIFMNIIQR